MLQNAYLVAKIGADTAENEQHFAEILPAFQQPELAGVLLHGPAAPRWARRAAWKFWQILGKMLLVFGCIGTDLCN